MNNFRRLVVLAACFVALAACAKTGSTAPDTTADAAAIRAVQDSWYKAYDAGDGAAIAALYTEDAVLSAPNKPALRGSASIREFYVKDAADFATTGSTATQGSTSDVGVSGDLAWQWGTYTIVDKSGATVETGKFTTLFQRKDGKWMIIRDTWNSDAPPAAPSAVPAPAAPPK
jgi:uncharacterized protein (TIGR02246 family)